MREPNVTENTGRQGGDGLPYNLFSSLCFAIRRDNGDITIHFGSCLGMVIKDR